MTAPGERPAVNASPRGEIARIFFVTGTDTGVGKTVFTALLCQTLISSGSRARALKPFCSGSRSDARLLHQLQGGALSLDEVNPYYFSEPLTPLISAHRAGRLIPLEMAVRFIKETAAGCESLLVEGAGGLLSPLGENFAAAELITALACDVIVVARNTLGTINHTLLTVRALPEMTQGRRKSGRPRLHVVLMDTARADLSSDSNALCLKSLLPSVGILRLPFLGPGAKKIESVRENAKKFHKELARILGTATF